MVLSEYLYDYMGSLAGYIGITTYLDVFFEFVIDEALATYGVDTEAEATDLKKLHAIAKVKLWEKFLIEVTGDYKFSADGGSYDRNQVYEMAKQNLAIANKEAYPYLSENKIKVGTFRSFSNPVTSGWYCHELLY